MGEIFRVLIELWYSDEDRNWRFGLIVLALVFLAGLFVFLALRHYALRA